MSLTCTKNPRTEKLFRQNMHKVVILLQKTNTNRFSLQWINESFFWRYLHMLVWISAINHPFVYIDYLYQTYLSTFGEQCIKNCGPHILEIKGFLKQKRTFLNWKHFFITSKSNVSTVDQPQKLSEMFDTTNTFEKHFWKTYLVF